MATPRSRKSAGQPAGGQFAVEARSETDVQLHAPADPTIEVTVPNPDDPFDMPIYEGPAAGAAARLIPGSYTAYGMDDDSTPYLLTVPDPGAIDRDGDLAHGRPRTATVEGCTVTMAMAYGDDDPEDATLPREVTVDRRDAGQVYFSFDDAAWRALPKDGGQMALEDTEDGAVRALVMDHKRRTTG